MSILLQLKRIAQKYFLNITLYHLMVIVAFYVTSTWYLLYLSHETHITTLGNFFYWLVVTASTVGYGDLSPSTTAGRLVTILWVIPVGLSLFAVVIGNAAATIAYQWRKGIKGMKNTHEDNHILIIGWSETRTLHLIKLLLREQKTHPQPAAIVLCTTHNIENPMVGDIGFVRVNSFTDDKEMARANIAGAKCIILDNETDDLTMTSALYSYGQNKNAHIIAYFKDDNLATLLKQHCPTIESTPSVAVEMIAKAAVDPGSSLLHHQLLDVDEGMTQYSIKYPTTEPEGKVAQFFMVFKEKYEATLIGITNDEQSGMQLNPGLRHPIKPGATIYYIADERIHTIDWSLCRV